MTTSAEYDELPYDDFPFPETHPAHLFVLGTLFGLAPPPLRACRVLELGCGRAGNLLPMAATMPDATFVGIDASSMHIAAARVDLDALALPNLRVHVLDIRDATRDLGEFDYILCHGVYSWVPDDVQRHILRVCHDLLAPDGLAYVSYNTLPGWHLRGLVRDVLLREAGRAGPVDARIARARDLLSLLAHLPASGATAWLRSEVDLLAGMSDAYLRYEHLADHNHPVYFRDFALAAARAGLAHVTDAHDWSRSTDRLPPEARAWIDARSSNLLDTEHYLDLLEPRFFRRSVLCHKERPIDRRVEWRRLEPLWLSADLAPDPSAPPLDTDAEETFTGPGDVTLSAAPPLLRAALRALHAAPRGLPFPDLVRAARAAVDAASTSPNMPVSPSPEPPPPSEPDLDFLGGNLLGLATQGVIELSPGPRPYAPAPGDRPATTPVARRQAASAAPGCITLRHRRVAVDPLDRSLLARMDGRRDSADLARGVQEDIAAGLLAIDAGGAPVEDLESIQDLVRQKLEHLAARAFILPDIP